MRRFGNFRPRGNVVVITDDRRVSALCRQKLSIFTLLVEPFLPYNLGCCFDLDVWVVMNGACDRVLAALRRAHARTHRLDRGGAVFWEWIGWMVDRQQGKTQLNAVAWFDAKRVRAHPPPGDA